MKKTNSIIIGIFTFCLLFSFKTFAANPFKFLIDFFNKKSVTPVEEASPSYRRPTPEEIEEFSRQRRMEELDDIDGISMRAVNHNAIIIDEQFDQTLDEILEIKGITREDIPREVLDHLRSFTFNPLKLFDPDNVLSHSMDYHRFIYGTVGEIEVSTIFSAHFIIGDYNDIYRAFFQKRLNPKNKQQMYQFRQLIDKLRDQNASLMRMAVGETESVTGLSREDILDFLCKHEGFTESAYKAWSENIFEKLYGKEVFKSLADDCFREGFDRETFFTLWEDKAFRKFIVKSKFMTKTHLTDRPDLLVAWSKELPDESYGGQFSDLIRSTFDEASGSPNPKQALAKDPFWKTVTRATRDDDIVRMKVKHILERITPVELDKPKPSGFGGGGGLA